MLEDRVLDVLEASYQNFWTCADLRAKLAYHLSRIDRGETEGVLRHRGTEAREVLQALVRLE